MSETVILVNERGIVNDANPLQTSATITGGGDASAANQTTIITDLGGVTETAPASDTASSGLNGRAQRIAQRLTSLIALIPTSLGQKAKTASMAVTLASDEDLLATAGAVADAAVTAGATGSISAKLRSISRDLIANIVLAAGENHIGAVGGHSTTIIPTITVSTTPAYSSNDSVGGKWTLTSAVRVSGGSGLLSSLMLLDRGNQKPTGTILVYNADPSASTITDNAGYSSTLADDQRVIARIPVVPGDWITVNAKAYARPAFNPEVVKAASGTSLYASFVLNGTTLPTFVATTDFQPVFGILQD